MDPVFNKFFSRIDSFNPNQKRKKRLDNIASVINENLNKTRSIVFLCTHNSRRSQICEVWGKVFAEIYRKKININSAGAFKTVVHSQVYESIVKCGLVVDNKKEIFFDKKKFKLNSKTIDSLTMKNFIAVMTCSNAEKSCPNDPRSIRNIKMFFNDPRIYDETDKMSREYLNTTIYIAEELNYIFKNIN
tara:strand:+ start:2001 stop:2567 length:567 start_codon:yes stop_codon:yes gene_type:complete